MIALSSAFSSAQATDSSETSIPQTVSASRGEREPDRADPAVEIPDRLAAGEPRGLARERVEPLGHRGVRLEERVRADAEAQAAELLLDPLLAPEQPRRQVRHLGGRVVDRPVDRAHLGEAAQDVDEVAGLELLAGRGHELDERLARVAALADDEVAEIAAPVGLRVRLEPLLARPVADGVADPVAELVGEPAALDLEHLVPAAGPVEAERRTLGRRGERVLELVAVVEDLRLARKDRLERRLGDAREPLQRVAHLHLLLLELRLVGEILEAAAAARGEVRARRVDALGPRPQDLGRERLRVAALDLRDPRADAVAREARAARRRRSRRAARRRCRRTRASRRRARAPLPLSPARPRAHRSVRAS